MEKNIPLINFDGNRHNNFTLIRILLSWSVLYGHSYAIQATAGVWDPLTPIFKGSTYIGDIAVNGFFAISGFLVAASFSKRGLTDYTLSRSLRVFPALVVCILLSVFILGPILTNLNTSAYFSDKTTHKYLMNAFPLIQINFNLPGVFQENIRPAVNGSLWTLIVELRCYILLAIAGLFGLLKDRTTANSSIFAIFLFGIYFFSDIPLLGTGKTTEWPRLSLFFLIGIFFFINRDKILLNNKIALLALCLAFASFGKPWFSFVFPPCFVYLLFYLAYLTPFVNVDNKVGDFSYGLYIYAWPVQQIVATTFPNLQPFGNTLLSSAIVIPIAYLSWHYIEKPSLSLKGKFLSTYAQVNIKSPPNA